MKDGVDILIDRLESTFPDIKWDRDALEISGDEDTGAVEVTGIQDSLWGDGGMTDAAWKADIWILRGSSGIEDIEPMGELLRAYNDEVMPISWDAPKRQYLADVGRIAWQWQIVFWGPVEKDCESEAGDG